MPSPTRSPRSPLPQNGASRKFRSVNGVARNFREKHGEDAFMSLARTVFKDADDDNSGFVDAREAKGLFKDVGISFVHAEEAEALFRYYDTSGDGMLDEGEFIQLVNDLLDGSFDEKAIKTIEDAAAAMAAGAGGEDDGPEKEAGDAPSKVVDDDDDAHDAKTRVPASPPAAASPSTTNGGRGGSAGDTNGLAMADNGALWTEVGLLRAENAALVARVALLEQQMASLLRPRVLADVERYPLPPGSPRE